MADYYDDDEAVTPAQCRNGPIRQRSCTNGLCCLFYLILIGVTIFFALFFSKATKMTNQQLLKELQSSHLGNPVVALVKATGPILISMGVLIALSIILNITTFLIPQIVRFLYVPLFLILMLLASATFLLRYLGLSIPFVSHEIQKQFAGAHHIVTLIIGLIFLLGFMTALSIILNKRDKFQYIIPVLKISKKFFWSNAYIFICSLVLTVISVSALVTNILFLDFSHTIDQTKMPRWIVVTLIIFQILCTHGFIEAVSDFFFESMAIHWYFRRRRIQIREQRVCSSFINTMYLIMRHCGSLVLGIIIAYIPEHLSSELTKFSKKSPCLYSLCCLTHRCFCDQTTKYGYIQIILQSIPYQEANKQMFMLRARTKALLPRLYVMGNFYNTLAKLFLVMFALVTSYFLIAQIQPHILSKPLNIIGPLIMTLLTGLQISNHFMNSTGIIGDTLVFMYAVDLQIEKKNYESNKASGCPSQVQQIIRKYIGEQKIEKKQIQKQQLSQE